MDVLTDKHERININWPVVLAYVTLPVLGISAWAGIIYLVRMALQ